MNTTPTHSLHSFGIGIRAQWCAKAMGLVSTKSFFQRVVENFAKSKGGFCGRVTPLLKHKVTARCNRADIVVRV